MIWTDEHPHDTKLLQVFSYRCIALGLSIAVSPLSQRSIVGVY